MNDIARKTRTARQTGQSLPEVLLILAAVAAALAVVFPTYEYLTLYRGSANAAPVRTPAPTPAPAPTPTPAAPPKAEPPKTPEAPPAKTPEAPKTAPTPAP